MGDFDRETKAVEQHLEALWRYIDEWAVPQRKFVEQILEHLSNTLEELEVAREELRQQNEELIAAQRIVESERQRYRELFEFVPDGYLMTDVSGVIQEANRAAESLFSINRYFLVGKPLVIFVSEGDRGSFGAQLNRLKNLKRVQDMELCLKPHKGAPFYASITVAPVRNPQEELIGLRWSIRDIAERKRVEEALRKNIAHLAKKNRYETIIGAVTRSIHRSINLQDVLENAVESMSKNIDGADNVSIYLVEGEDLGELSQAEAVLKAFRGYPDWWIERVRRIPYPKGFTWKAIIEGKPTYCADVDRDTVIGPAGREMGTKSYASMPIHFGGKIVGVININSFQKNAFNDEELRLLEIVAQQIEIAINNAQRAEALQKAKEELELRVQERTRELSEINEELKKEIAWRKKAEKSLRDSEERYRALYENNPSMYFTVDREGKILSLNRFGAEQLGYTVEGLIGQSVFNIFYEEDREAVIERFVLCLQNIKQIIRWEFRKVRKDGSILWVRESARAIQGSDGGMVVLIVCEDITDRRRAEEQLRGSLREKEMLFKEVHHRVKNNLQVISSLLDLQSDYLKDRQAIEMMSKSRNRVRSMALVHERLYQSKNMTKIDFAEYIRDLTDSLFCFYGVNLNRVKLRIDAEGVLLNINSAIPLGLIINELVSNSLKYAFPRGKKGEISISLRSDNGGSDLPGRPEFTLTVGNNGVGFPRDLNFRETKSLGLQLVVALVDQIGGTIELDRTNGARFKIRFTEPKLKEEINTLIE
jgi:PAS domain S-box-containing protein